MSDIAGGNQAPVTDVSAAPSLEEQPRRRRRRRRRALEMDGPQQRFRIALLVVIVLMILSLSVGDRVRPWLRGLFQHLHSFVPPGVARMAIRPEVIVLVIAALILIYLMMPDAEYRLLSFLGLRSPRHRRKSG